MSDHLPECRDALIPDFHNERWICICPALRACEQRVRMGRMLTWDEYEDVKRRAYAAGVQAARDATDSQRSKFKARDWDDAIDAAVAAIKNLQP